MTGSLTPGLFAFVREERGREFVSGKDEEGNAINLKCCERPNSHEEFPVSSTGDGTPLGLAFLVEACGDGCGEVEDGRLVEERAEGDGEAAQL
ncbi:hypothetical protein [uncultured Paludibaculum sp.]|uniref:hypothetical protein n=1 Tax=uncultured Paludibaculum sp. TaxID=1765020 RepID=UPI002AAB694F|nr:hypothetical protein [uncultured Paludibaculum sp.]